MGVIYSVALFWLCVHAAQVYYEHTSRGTTLLPSSVGRARPQWLSRLRWRKVEVIVKPLTISVSSVQINEGDGPLATCLIGSHVCMRWLIRAYDVGVIICAVGQVAAIALVAFTVTYLAIPMVDTAPVPLNNAIPKSHLARRMQDTASTLAPTGNRDLMFLQPIIPGVTVPMWHVWFIFPALLIAQVIHEAGHFITAVLCSVSVHSIGASLILVLPAAFVALDQSSMNSRRSMERLRIIAAGAFHNITSYIIILSCAWFGMGSIALTFLGYGDISRSGLAVLDVERDSGLARHLDPGSIVVRLDDTPMATIGSSRDPQDVWTQYLLTSYDSTDALGWCVGHPTNQDEEISCCWPQGRRPIPPEVPLSCFVPTSEIRSEQNIGRCLDPIPILTPAGQNVDPARCRRDTECSENQACMALASKEQLMRITIIPPGDERRVIVWDGPREEVFEQVAVGLYVPRFSWLPYHLPSWMSLFFEYLKLISLSLYFFNLLPLPFLDGSQFLSTLLDRVLIEQITIQQEDHSLDDLETAQHIPYDVLSRAPQASATRAWKRRVEVFASRGTMGLVGLGAALGTWSHLRSL